MPRGRPRKHPKPVKEIHAYKPTPKQQEFHKALQKYKYVCFMGGFGSGKTKAGAWQSIDLALKYPGNRILVGRATYRELQDSTKAQYIQELIEHEIPFEERKSEEKIIITPTRSELLFRSLDDIFKLQSLEIGAFHIDEASEVEEEFFKTLKGRLRLSTVPRRVGYLTTNPPDVTHWLYKYFVSEKNDEHYIVHSSIYDNPYLPEDYIKNLEQEYANDASWRRRFIEGQFGFLAEGEPVYGAFNEKVHVAELNWNRYLPVYRTWDFGFHHPAVVWSQVDNDGRWYVLREDLGSSVSLREYADHIIRKSNEYFPGAQFIDFCDPAGTQVNDKSELTSVQILQSEFKIYPSFRRSRIEEGIDLIRKKLITLIGDKPALMIDKSCKIIHDAFEGGYHYAEVKEGQDSDKIQPFKDGYYEHLMDCIRYTAINIFDTVGVQRSRNIRFGGPEWGRV